MIIFVYGYYIKQITTNPKTIKLVFVASPLKHVALRRKGKDWLARNQDNVSCSFINSSFHIRMYVRCHGSFVHVDVKIHISTCILKFINLKRIYYKIDICKLKFLDLFLVFFSPLSFLYFIFIFLNFKLNTM
jgi:hypothetical protein